MTWVQGEALRSAPHCIPERDRSTWLPVASSPPTCATRMLGLGPGSARPSHEANRLDHQVLDAMIAEDPEHLLRDDELRHDLVPDAEALEAHVHVGELVHRHVVERQRVQEESSLAALRAGVL